MAAVRKWVLGVVALTIAVPALALLILAIFINPNRFKPQISAELRARTGWSVPSRRQADA